MASAGAMYRVRPAAVADLRAVWEVMTENQAVAPPEVEQSRPDEVSRVHRVAWERMMGTSDLSVYVAECGTEAVGTAGMLVVPNLAYDCRPTAFIEPVVVKYRHRRRGVARALLNRALADARSLGCFKVQMLHTSAM
jgi:GNAT superfamily N-acetyltransferase